MSETCSLKKVEEKMPAQVIWEMRSLKLKGTVHKDCILFNTVISPADSNDSETTVHVYWNETIKPKWMEGISFLAVGVGDYR